MELMRTRDYIPRRWNEDNAAKIPLCALLSETLHREIKKTYARYSHFFLAPQSGLVLQVRHVLSGFPRKLNANNASMLLYACQDG